MALARPRARGGRAAPDAAVSALGKVELRPPGHSGYERLSGVLDESSVVKGAHGVSVDVTGQVRRAGSGVYTVANVQSATGADRYAGWSLVVAYEGDRGFPGDSAALDGKALTDARNPGNNCFNSSITTDGREFTAKTPDYANQLGFDAKLTRVDGILANGASSATIALRTSSDQ
jgi:hypothetical protein